MSKLSEEDSKRFEKLFVTLDTNKDGKIEIKELTEALSKKSSNRRGDDIQKEVQKILIAADEDKSSEISFVEFVSYMQQHEKQLKLAFSDLDHNKDGKIEPKEVKESLKQLGLNIDLQEAETLTRKIDKDGSLSLDWEEWRSFFELYPTGSLEDMILHWRQSLMIDIGDSLTVPPEFTKNEKATGLWWRHLVAGGIAGVVSRTATAPLDRLKVLLQVHGSKTGGHGIVGGLKFMIKEGGIKSLWRGNGTNVLKIAPESALKFGAYEQFKKLLKGDSDRELTSKDRFIAGSSAGAFAQTIIYPMEVVKTRLAVAKSGQYKGMVHCLSKIMKKEGFFALYRGYIPNILGIIPYAGIDLTVYETLKNYYKKTHPDVKDPGVMVLLGCGTASSTVGQLSSYPLALIRTRLQAGVCEDSKKGVIPLAAAIIRNEGILGLYRGIAPNFLKVLPAVSISYVVYEKSKKALHI